jgi:hypothetical protein
VDASEAGRLTDAGGINGRNGRDVIYGSDLGELILHEDGDGVIVGGGGNDDIRTGDGDDIIDGGSGNDNLHGDTGNDTYIFRIGSGRDIIYEADPTPDNSDTIWLGGYLAPEDVSLKRLKNDLILTVNGTSLIASAIRKWRNNDQPEGRDNHTGQRSVIKDTSIHAYFSNIHKTGNLCILYIFMHSYSPPGARDLGLYAEFGWDLFRTLPTDEQMIEHFRKHRADFDKLAQHYSRFPGADPTPELMALMDRINVTRVSHDMVTWVPTDSSPHDDSRRYSGVVLHYGHPGVRKFDDYLSSVNKLYYYTPFPAPVEDGRLCRPYPSLPLDIFPSLNTYPCELEPHAPVLRKIDSLWYLQMRIQWPEQ